MKAKQIAKRLRARSVELHRTALIFPPIDSALAERARLLGDVLREVADQVAPLSKKKRKAAQSHAATKIGKGTGGNGEQRRRDSAAA